MGQGGRSAAAGDLRQLGERRGDLLGPLGVGRAGFSGLLGSEFSEDFDLVLELLELLRVAVGATVRVELLERREHRFLRRGGVHRRHLLTSAGTADGVARGVVAWREAAAAQQKRMFH